MTIPEQQARTFVKAINRRCRRGKLWGNDRYGTYFATWYTCNPQVASAYIIAATALAGRPGRYMPRAFGHCEW